MEVRVCSVGRANDDRLSRRSRDLEVEQATEGVHPVRDDHLVASVEPGEGRLDVVDVHRRIHIERLRGGDGRRYQQSERERERARRHRGNLLHDSDSTPAADCPAIHAGEAEVGSTPGRIRTYDSRLRRPELYPTELRALNAYGVMRGGLDGKTGSGWRDSNPRQRAPKARALPGCATPREASTIARSEPARDRNRSLLFGSDRQAEGGHAAPLDGHRDVASAALVAHRDDA